MKTKICILKGTNDDLSTLLQLLKEWSTQNNAKLELAAYSKEALMLPSSISEFNLLFFFSEEDEQRNLTIIRSLWKLHYRGEFVILHKKNYSSTITYKYHTIHTIALPIAFDHIDTILTYVKESQISSNYVFRHYNTYIRIPYSDILFFSSDNQYTLIQTKQNTFRQSGTLTSISSSLPKEFQKCHRTTIVNMKYVNKLEPHNLELYNGEVLPISKTYQDTIKSIFFDSSYILK